MESCFSTIKTELVHQACYESRDAARRNLFAYIEGYYNHQRLYIAPDEAERQAAYASVHQIGGRSTRSHAQEFTSSMQLSPDEISAA